MIRAMLYNPSSNSISKGSVELIEQWRADRNSLLWVDLDDEDVGNERELLLGTFEIHPLAVQDALRDRRPPKMEDFANIKFILLRGLSAETENIDFGVIQLALFVGERLLITRHKLRSVSTERVWQDALSDNTYFENGSGGLAIRLMGRVVRRFITVLLELESRLDELENEVFDRPRDALLSELTRYKSRLKQLRRVARYHLQIAAELKTDPGQFISAELRHEIVEVYEQLERSLSLAELYYEFADDLINGYLAFASHKLNQIMRVLTVFTVIFVPLTFLAGIYGMNFDNMPELHMKMGYFVVLGVMAVIVIGQIVFLKYRKWL
ncbi:MAG: magnesium transporter [Gammaproteobacteria bacterium]|jgi:magnesium transporter